jgi:YHS domain-containing protein
METDPVCKMKVDPKNAPATSTYQGKVYYFCSAGCKKEFDQEPQKFIHSDQTTHHSG